MCCMQITFSAIQWRKKKGGGNQRESPHQNVYLYDVWIFCCVVKLWSLICCDYDTLFFCLLFPVDEKKKKKPQPLASVPLFCPPFFTHPPLSPCSPLGTWLIRVRSLAGPWLYPPIPLTALCVRLAVAAPLPLRCGPRTGCTTRNYWTATLAPTTPLRKTPTP